MNILFSMIETKSRASAAFCLFLMLCIVLASGCSKTPEAPKGKLEQLQSQDEYKDWKIYSYDRVKILYPENHPRWRHDRAHEAAGCAIFDNAVQHCRGH